MNNLVLTKSFFSLFDHDFFFFFNKWTSQITTRVWWMYKWTTIKQVKKQKYDDGKHTYTYTQTQFSRSYFVGLDMSAPS